MQWIQNKTMRQNSRRINALIEAPHLLSIIIVSRPQAIFDRLFNDHKETELKMYTNHDNNIV